MAITSQDYQLTDIWTDVAGRDYHNVYFVRHVSGPQSALDVANCFATYMTPRIADILHTSMENTETSVFSLENPLDYASVTTAVNGTRGLQSLPSFVAAGFTIVRSSRAFRDSGKRYGRLSEGDVTGNGFEAAFQTNLGSVQDGLLDIWINGAVEAQLMMPRRELTAGSYVLIDLSRPSSVKGAIVTSQNSRK